MILELRRLSKHFRGIKAVDNLNLTVEDGELSSIIGPNGAGKTTLFHLITGYHRATEGEVIFKGENITNQSAQTICRKGIIRSFQVMDIYPRLSVFQNVQLSVLSRQRKTLGFFASVEHMAEEETLEHIHSVGLDEQIYSLGGSLSRGDQKRLELAIALACQPQLLLLDEPTAGMSPVERIATVELIERLTKEERLTTVFTEHDMDMVFAVSEKIRVMSFGKVVAAGTPSEIRKNEMVQEIYLGRKA